MRFVVCGGFSFCGLLTGFVVGCFAITLVLHLVVWVCIIMVSKFGDVSRCILGCCYSLFSFWILGVLMMVFRRVVVGLLAWLFRCLYCCMISSRFVFGLYYFVGVLYALRFGVFGFCILWFLGLVCRYGFS